LGGGYSKRLLGIDILKIIMCFGVIICHFWDADMGKKTHIIFNTLRCNAVHTFILLAFFFTAHTIESRDWNLIGIRIMRLLKPFYIWPIIMFVLYNLSSLILNGRLKFGLRDIGAQYFMGHTEILVVMYFNWIVMVLTIIYALIFYLLSRKTAFIFLIISGIWALSFVYTGKNYAMFSKLPPEMSYPLGRLAELYPTACVGIALSHINFNGVREKISNIGVWTLFYCITGFEIIWMMLISPTLMQYFPAGQFNYGYPYHIALSIWFFIIGFYFNGSSLPVLIRKIISEIGHYTVGVYCVHMIVGLGLQYLIDTNGIYGRRTLRFCTVCFAACLVIVYGISRLPWKWCKEIVK